MSTSFLDIDFVSRFDVSATAAVYFHRFYMFHSFTNFHRYVCVFYLLVAVLLDYVYKRGRGFNILLITSEFLVSLLFIHRHLLHIGIIPYC